MSSFINDTNSNVFITNLVRKDVEKNIADLKYYNKKGDLIPLSRCQIALRTFASKWLPLCYSPQNECKYRTLMAFQEQIKEIKLERKPGDPNQNERVALLNNLRDMTLTGLAESSISSVFDSVKQSIYSIRTSHAWQKDEKADRPRIERFLAENCWNNRKNNNNHSGLRELLGKEKFDLAMQADDFKAFLSLFEDLSVDDLWNIRNNLNCQPLGFVKTELYEITEEDRINLKQYLDDIGFSGVVTLSDAKGTYCICPTGKESLETTPFSMHSIAKVFTGTLALMMMPPEAFNLKLDLAPSILSDLEKLNQPVYDHLKIPTLHQIMNHNGGFGDYLDNYANAVEDALKQGKTLPAINKPEDFLKYAETHIYELDKGLYSNLGILLVGLAIQHKCHDRPFDQLLKELILIPANIDISPTRPANGKYNKDDPCQGMVVGSPSGGYWTTSDELLKLGTWLLKKCNDPVFLAAMEKNGGEFYVKADQEIRHNGCSYSGSSYLSSFRESGVTIAVLSDQSNFMANRVYHTIREQMIEKRE